jgi:glycosyltransferase involved in cell wall biosynthesis
MKILLCNHSLGHGGAERVITNLSSEWADLGWNVTVLTLSSSANDFYRLHEGVQRIALDLTSDSNGIVEAVAANLRRIMALRRVFRQVKPDIVLGIQTSASVLSILAALGLPCKVIATEHNHPPMLPLGRFWETLRRWTYPKAAAVVALTNDTRKWLETVCHCNAVEVVPNPVSLPIPLAGRALSPAAFVDPHRRVLLAAGRLTEQKGFDFLIDAFARIAARQPHWDLVILGEGEGRGMLERRRSEAGLDGRIILPGVAGNVADWYARADLFVLSSRFEGFPMTLIEAMASGCAAVSFDCDAGPRDIVTHGYNGLLVNPVGDVAKLAAALAELMADDSGRELMATRAPNVMQTFSSARVVSMWQDLFERIDTDRSRPVDTIRMPN